MKNKNILAFTLVELIVVVTILAILATIGFVSYSSYLTGVRDTNRLAQLVSISDGLELYSTKNNLPLPDDNVEIQANGLIVAYQGFAGANTLETIDFTKGGKDPRDDQYFTYYLTKDRKYFQLMGFLEESLDATSQLSSPSWKGMPIGQGKLSFIEKSHAGDYDDRIPTVYGKKLGILTDTDNTPIQDITTIQTDGLLAIDVTTDSYIARLTDKTSITGDNTELSVLVSALTPASSNPTSCKEALSPKTYLKDGIYRVKLNGTKTDVYCDMTTEGGGWTLVHKTTDSATNLTGALDTNEGTLGWDTDEEYRLSINFWEGLSTEKAMAKNLRVDGLEWNDITDGQISSISTSAVGFSGTDTYHIFGQGTYGTSGTQERAGTYYWLNNGCSRCVNYNTNISSFGAVNSPMLRDSITSYTGSAVEGAGGTNDASYHVMEKMGIFLK